MQDGVQELSRPGLPLHQEFHGQRLELRVHFRIALQDQVGNLGVIPAAKGIEDSGKKLRRATGQHRRERGLKLGVPE